MSTQHSLAAIAASLDQAAMQANAIAQISNSTPITLDEAYEIQKLSIQQRLQRGETLIGLKMGFTSEAKMQQMGVHDMIWGRLTSSMLVADGGTFRFSDFIHPRAEPEICFRISNDIDRELGLDEIRNYVDGVAGAIEIIDSRYENFKFSLEDVVADNCSSVGFVVGAWHSPETPVANLNIALQLDGQTAETGNSDDILGDPWKALCAATRLAVKYGEPIKKGMYIMAGAASAAAFIKPEQTVSASIETLGSISFQVQ